jgi:hypothetical protein
MGTELALVESQPTTDLLSESDIAKLTSRLNHAFAEASAENDGNWRQVGGNRTPGTYSGGHNAILTNWSSLDDRIDGRFRPFYENEHDLRDIRAKSRNLATFTSIAVGADKALEVYTIGGKWQFEAKLKDDGTANAQYEIDASWKKNPNDPRNQLLAAVQRVIDEVIEKNEFQESQLPAIHSTARTDGEALIAVYGDKGGIAKIRMLDADSLREPQATNAKQIERGLRSFGYSQVGQQSWTFGVHTSYNRTMRRVDHSDPMGYHVVFDESGKEWDYLPSFPQADAGPISNRCLVHFKGYSVMPLDAKRGVSDYYPIQEVLERKHILGRNLSIGAAIQASIAYIRHHKGNVTRADVVTQISSALDSLSRTATGNRNDGRTQQNFGPGTVIDVKDQEYHAGPLGELKSAVFIEVCSYLMRCVGTRFLMPEYIISGDASNANFASTLVSEAPFVKARESDQQKTIGVCRRTLWATLKIAFDAGRFARWCPTWQQFRDMVELSIKAPPVASRDKVQLLAEVESLYEKRLISANDALTDLGREAKPGFDDKFADPPPAPVIGGVGGAIGGNPSVVAAKQAATAAALESAETTDEAKLILESINSDER